MSDNDQRKQKEVILVATDAANTVVDIDGNVYRTVKIGSQIWMAENLRVIHYRNGDPIQNDASVYSWGHSCKTWGAYCEYDNDINNVITYGRLYNWFAVNEERLLAPVGWHVPSDAEWKQLERHIGLREIELDKYGSRGFNENGRSANVKERLIATGFSLIFGGHRQCAGDCMYLGMGMTACFWTSDEHHGTYAWYRELWNKYDDEITRQFYEKGAKPSGLSVRCVKD